MKNQDLCDSCSCHTFFYVNLYAFWYGFIYSHRDRERRERFEGKGMVKRDEKQQMCLTSKWAVTMFQNRGGSSNPIGQDE